MATFVKLNLEKAWNTLRDTPFYTFNFKDEIEGTALHHGPIVDECPEDLILPTQKQDEVGIINTVNSEKLLSKVNAVSSENNIAAGA